MISRISSPPPAVFGIGASEQLGEELKALGLKKVLVVHGRVVKKTGIIDRLTGYIKDQGIEVVTYDRVSPDPPAEVVDEGAELAKKEKVDGIVGVGGGSALDSAKAINVLMGNPAPITRYHDKSIPLNPGIKLVLLPTTSGTGSEMNAISVVTDTEKDVKSGVVGGPCVADLAIVDPSFTMGLPANITAVTGLDAFSHGVEAITSGFANPFSETLGEKAVQLVCQYLPVAVKDPDNEEARIKLSFASMIAGKAFNDANVHLGHAMAHALGSYFHIPHGVACAHVLPETVEHVVDDLPDKVKVVGKAMGVDVEGKAPAELGKTVGDAIRNLVKELGIETLKEVGVKKESLKDVVPLVFQDDCYIFMPNEITEEQVLQRLNNAYQK